MYITIIFQPCGYCIKIGIITNENTNELLIAIRMETYEQSHLPPG